MDEEQPKPVLLGGVPVETPDAASMRLAMLIWGDSGCGKTTLAATAPGTKLVLLFDPDGDLSLANRSDVVKLDLTDRNPTTIMAQFKMADPFGLTNYLKANPHIETVIVDSVTTLAYTALLEAVASNRNSTLEQPGMHGYTWRNSTVLRTCTSLMRITKQLDRNLILITHEATPDRDAEGNIVSISMALSEGTANQVGLRLNEVWWMSDVRNERKIAIRPVRNRRPMKTRLFIGDKPEFTWHYDPETGAGEGIADWFHQWQGNGGRKIPLPARVVSTTSRGAASKK